MKEKANKLLKWIKAFYVPVVLLFILYSTGVTKNYTEALLYIGMLIAFILAEWLYQIKTSLDRIFYQIYLLKEKKDD